jgi:hypothetical protein
LQTLTATELMSPAHLGALSLRTWATPPHLRAINRRLQRVAAGKLDRLAIALPPRHGKSLLVSQFFPAWFLLVHPEKRVILCSYEADFASQWGRKVRDLVAQWGPVFGVSVAADSKAADRWEIQGHGGGMQTAGVGGPILGKGADVLILDDLTKNAQEAMSPTHREKTWDWLTSTAFTRLEPGGAVVNIQQRWHPDDVTGQLLTNEGDRWDVLTLPAIAEANDPLGRPVGAALWPERYPLAELERKRALSPGWFAAQYQQQPRAFKGAVFPSEWLSWPLFLVPSVPEDGVTLRLLYLDPSWGKQGRGDDQAFTLLSHWPGPNKEHIIYLESFPLHTDIIDMVSFGVRLCRDRGVTHWGFEVNGTMGLLSAEVQRQLTAANMPHVRAWGVEHTGRTGSKEDRITNGLMPYLQRRAVRIVDTAGGRQLKAQLSDHPHSTHDDSADSAAGAVEMWEQILLSA